MSDLWILARGEADELERGLFDKRALTTVRYADPAAWVVATAAARAMAGARDAVAAAGEGVGVLVTSPRGPVETIAAVAQAAREGFSSPLRYPASSPGSPRGRDVHRARSPRAHARAHDAPGGRRAGRADARRALDRAR